MAAFACEVFQDRFSWAAESGECHARISRVLA